MVSLAFLGRFKVPMMLAVAFPIPDVFTTFVIPQRQVCLLITLILRPGFHLNIMSGQYSGESEGEEGRERERKREKERERGKENEGGREREGGGQEGGGQEEEVGGEKMPTGHTEKPLQCISHWDFD